MADASSDQVAERVVDAVFGIVGRLPRRCLPPEGQWIPCSAVVIEYNQDTDPAFECVALATGAKCLPTAKVGAAGQVLHDSHAEILALRVFNAVLLHECQKLAASPTHTSRLVQRAEPGAAQPFALHPGLRLYLYSSEAPCGDASMELVMASQEDATPWAPRAGNELSGRGHFGELGIVRRKPARADSPSTLSKSCSDKLALRQCTSVLASVTALLVSARAAYLHALVLPASQVVPAAMRRCFSAEGRMQAVDGRDWGGGYAFRPFRVLGCAREFAYSRRVVASGSIAKPSAVWCEFACEVLINGILQGRRMTDANKASLASRERLWRAAACIVETEPGVDRASSFEGLKQLGALAERRLAKQEAQRRALVGWVRNAVDDFLL